MFCYSQPYIARKITTVSFSFPTLSIKLNERDFPVKRTLLLTGNPVVTERAVCKGRRRKETKRQGIPTLVNINFC